MIALARLLHRLLHHHTPDVRPFRAVDRQRGPVPPVSYRRDADGRRIGGGGF